MKLMSQGGTKSSFMSKSQTKLQNQESWEDQFTKKRITFNFLSIRPIMKGSHQGSGQQVGKSFYEKAGYRKNMRSGPIFCIAKPPVTSIRTTLGSSLGKSETLNPSSFSSGLAGACNQRQVLEKLR
jgi:hypothetical protein